MTTVFAHNADCQRGPCAICKQPATWTLTANVGVIGSLKTDLCAEHITGFDIPAWGRQAELRVMAGLEKMVRDNI